MKLYVKLDLTVEERAALEKRFGFPLSRQVAEHWCETELRRLILGNPKLELWMEVRSPQKKASQRCKSGRAK